MALIFSKKRCQGCKRKLKKDEVTHEFRIGTADGILELEVCNVCADILDMSADILRKKHRDPEREGRDQEDPSEAD